MAYNVFGNTITDETLKGLPEYADKQIERLDRAHVALNMKNAVEKDFNARTYVEKLKEQYGDGISTLCLVYNATGDIIRYAYKKDWYGHIGMAPYPRLIANGQWGAYLHVKTAGAATGSTAAVVYRGLNNAGNECDWLLSWSNPWDRASSDNTVITEIRDPNHFEAYWDVIYGYLEGGKAYSKDTWNGCVSIMSTGSDTSPIVEAILTLENAETMAAMAAVPTLLLINELLFCCSSRLFKSRYRTSLIIQPSLPTHPRELLNKSPIEYRTICSLLLSIHCLYVLSYTLDMMGTSIPIGLFVILITWNYLYGSKHE